MQLKTVRFYEIWEKSSVAEPLFFEYSTFLGCDSVSLGSLFATFR